MRIKQYLDEILNRIAVHPFLEFQNISFEERPPDAVFISGLIGFTDGSRLHFKEFVILGPDAATLLKYGYNYVSKEENLIFRYDNAWDPKAKGFTTYPEHKHTAQGLFPSQKPDLEDILLEISNLIEHIV